MKMNAPIKIEMKVYAIEEESGQQAQDALPEGFRVMDKSEFFNAYLQEEYGTTEKFATPGSREFTDEVIEMPKEKGHE